MAKSIDNLKLVIMENSASITLYYGAWGENYADLMEPVKEVAYQLIEVLNESEEEDDAAELQEYLERCTPTADDIRNFDFRTGWVSCTCDCFAEGKDIVPKAAEFLEETFELDFYEEDEEDSFEDDECDEDDEEDEGVRRRAIVEKAKQNPEDYDTVVAFMNMILDYLEDQNDCTIRY